MYLVEVFFKFNSNENSLNEQLIKQTAAVNQVIDQWRYNGQIIGREIPVFLAEQEGETGLAARVICPEQQSLLPDYNNAEVGRVLANAANRGVKFSSFQIVGEDLNSDPTFEGDRPAWQVMHTTYLQVCSPLHSGDRLAPIPLYKQLRDEPHLSMDLIKWQENWQACDQLQMNATVLESPALREISHTDSNLFKHGYYLARAIERHSGVPTYYYLYRAGGESLQQEQQRRCPLCGGEWALEQPLFDQFHFKCDKCRLVSNLSWNFL